MNRALIFVCLLFLTLVLVTFYGKQTTKSLLANTILNGVINTTSHDGFQLLRINHSSACNRTQLKKTSLKFPLAVFFTTFGNKTDKNQIYENTLKNWATFLPYVQPILFDTTGRKDLNKIAITEGWIVLQHSRVNPNGTPYLRDMYEAAYAKVLAPNYAYANGDILFDHGLVKTLIKVNQDKDILKNILLVGKRWNHDMLKSDYSNLWQQETVKQIAKPGISELFRDDAEDYFLVEKNFPWNQLKDVVIGRPAYDNYLVAKAKQLKVTTIDATSTISAVHQTSKDGNFAGHHYKDSGYNRNLIGKFNYGAGLISGVWLQTSFDYKGEVMIKKKTAPTDVENMFRKRYVNYLSNLI